MGKRDTKQTLADVKQSQATTQQNFQQARDQSAATTAGLGDVAAQDKANLASGYQNLSAGQVDTSGLSDLGSRYRALADNPIDTAAKSRILGDIGNIRTSAGQVTGQGDALAAFGQTGGLDAESANRFRGLGVYDEYAKTGGYSDADKANIRARALSPISSYATGTRDELARRAAISGGYTPGFDAASRALRRDTARNIADTSLNAETGIMDRVIANRMAAAQGASQAEGAYQGLRTGNMLRGMEGAASAYGQAGGLYSNAASQEGSLQDRINQYTLAGLDGARATEAAISDVNAANANRQLTAQTAGLGGLQDIYGSDVGQLEASRARDTGLLSGQASSNLAYYTPRTQLATQPGVGGLIANAAGAGLGLAAGFMNPAKGLGSVVGPTGDSPYVGYGA
jgi:hypothetical protein